MAPKIEYESREEYETLINGLKRDYQNMISEGLGIALRKEDLSNTWREYHEGASMGVRGHWQDEGMKLWLKLTKGLDEAWCTQMGHILGYILNRTIRTAFSVQRTNSKKRQTNQQIFDMLLPLLLDEINEFIEPKFWPNHMEAFLDINFPFVDIDFPD